MSGVSSALLELRRIAVAFAGRAALSDVSLATVEQQTVEVRGFCPRCREHAEKSP